MIEDTVPKAKVRQIAEQFHKLVALKDRQAAVQAELIRWCVAELRADNNYHRIRGHEDLATQRRIRDENRKNKALALLYLEWLADKLEGKDVPPSPISSDDLTQSIEGDDDVHRGDSTS